MADRIKQWRVKLASGKWKTMRGVCVNVLPCGTLECVTSWRLEASDDGSDILPGPGSILFAPGEWRRCVASGDVNERARALPERRT